VTSGRGPYDPATPQDEQLLTWPDVNVRLACKACRKLRTYRLARLVDTFGSEITMAVLLDRLTINCPRRRYRDLKGRIKERISNEPCGAYYPDLTDPPRPKPTGARPDLRPVTLGKDLVTSRLVKEARRALRG